MRNQANFILNLSVLYRNTQKYFDKVLVPYDIGSGQLIFLLCVNENEGITMQEVTAITEVDKGTTTKSVQRLIDQGYVQSLQDEKDHRVKRLYTTEKAAGIMNSVYEFRNNLRSILAKDMDFAAFEDMLDQAADNSRSDLKTDTETGNLKIGGLQKMTLLDYPGKAAATVFLSGCNYKCPYCHNRELVFIPENYDYFDNADVFSYLHKRHGILDGVCVSGGEPLMQEGITAFLGKIKELGYLVKIDTNGSMPQRLKELVEMGLVDYVAMDVKNTPEKYAMTAGMNSDAFNMDAVNETIEYLKSDVVEYEFRTTLVKEFHTAEDVAAIAQWLAPAKRYYLQQFCDTGNLITDGLTAFNEAEMEELRAIASAYIPTAALRGVKRG